MLQDIATLARKAKEQVETEEEAEKFSLGELEEQIKQAERNITVLEKHNIPVSSIKYWYAKLERLRIIKELKLKLEEDNKRTGGD